MERAGLAQRLGARGGVMAGGACPLLLDEREPRAFMERFVQAAAGGAEVFLVDPEWPAAKRAELAALLASSEEGEGVCAGAERGWLMIPTGGTSGRLKFARHDGVTLAAAVAGFQAHFGWPKVNAIGVLPLHHVSGLMAWMRCALSGGQFVPWDWKRLEGGEFPLIDPAAGAWTISLVPTQLQRLLPSSAACAWLRQFAAVFLGGGPSWRELADAAAAARLPLALSYGMTETAAMVAAQRPAEFAAGDRSCGAALPHARVALDAAGRVTLTGASLFRGYYPDRRQGAELVTEDLGTMDDHGRLTILGRRDEAIITGGRKVHAAEVEAALRASGEFTDVVVLGLPDREWGEAVVAFHPAGAASPDIARATASLAPWQRPKRFIVVSDWPRNAQGKIDRGGLRQLAGSQGGAEPGPARTT